MRNIILIFIVAFSLMLFGCTGTQTANESNDDLTAVKNVVESFGQNLQMVSLLQPTDQLKESMRENYGHYVSAGLIEKWLANPQNAPGRLTSSPWPERIDILETRKISQDAYEVMGEIIEVTGTEQKDGEAAAKRPITLKVERGDNQWLITDVTLGDYEEAELVYDNTDYGFTFSLPRSWEGYTIVTDQWEGRALDGDQVGNVVATGPKLSIRHPLWTSDTPRQDIPIMIFTIDQWNDVVDERVGVSAAPIPPSELGRNSKYVFALPARYNFAFPEGFEEVDQVLNNNPLKPTEVLK